MGPIVQPSQEKRTLMKRVVTRLRLFRAGWIVCGLIAVAVTASAQESLHAMQVVGKWVGTLQAAGRSPASVEVEFKPDGAFDGGSNAGQADEVSFVGRWKADGNTIRLDFTAEGPEEKSEVSWTLKRNGGELSGRAIRQLGKFQYEVTLRRVK